MSFLQNENGKITDGLKKSVQLRGVNLGNWLLLEGFMLGGPNEPEHRIRASVAATAGVRQARSFFKNFQDVFIQAADLRRIRRWGFNVVRVPFNYRLLLPSPEGRLYERDGWARLDWVIRECSRIGLYCLLDLHAAPGAQNADWHSDSPGRAGLWSSEKDREKTAALWEQISRHYRHEPALAGYDLLNEPDAASSKHVLQVYQRCLEAIRSTGDHHLIFVEGTEWSDHFAGIEALDDDQLVYSPHFYKPTAFTFHFEPGLTYPGMVEGKYWDKESLRSELSRFAILGRKRQRPVLIGEFGLNSRCPSCHTETDWLKDVVALFESFGFHWAYWSYKALGGPYFPTGLMRLPGNPPWLRREGPNTGWKNFGAANSRTKQNILAAMDSRHFKEDSPVLKELQRFL
jgi:aryl-phospho-beta-D-glucosidase BglC (GH1 family)